MLPSITTFRLLRPVHYPGLCVSDLSHAFPNVGFGKAECKSISLLLAEIRVMAPLCRPIPHVPREVRQAERPHHRPVLVLRLTAPFLPEQLGDDARPILTSKRRTK